MRACVCVLRGALGRLYPALQNAAHLPSALVREQVSAHMRESGVFIRVCHGVTGIEWRSSKLRLT